MRSRSGCGEPHRWFQWARQSRRRLNRRRSRHRPGPARRFERKPTRSFLRRRQSQSQSRIRPTVGAHAQIRALIDGFAAAVQRQSIGLSDQSCAADRGRGSRRISRLISSRGENFKASTTDVDISVHGDTATASFKLMLKFNDRAGRRPQTTQSFQYHAEFARHGKKWSFTKLQER